MAVEQVQGAPEVRALELPQVDPNSALGIALAILAVRGDNIEDERVMRQLEDELKKLIKQDNKINVEQLTREGWANMVAPTTVAAIAAALTVLGGEGGAIYGQVLGQMSQTMTQGYVGYRHTNVREGAMGRKQTNEQELQGPFQSANSARQQTDQTASQVASQIVQR